MLALALLGAALQVQAVTNSWRGTADADWFNGINWSEGTCPADGQDVIITNTARSPLLTNSPASLASFVLTNNTVTFTNWETCLTAATVTIRNGGLLTLPPAFTNTLMSNRVCIVCTNFTLDAGGTIDADGKGYGGRTGTEEIGLGHGPGAGNYVAGGGYGGKGGNWSSWQGGSPYGSTNAPCQPGSGAGGGPAWTGTAGGGAIWAKALHSMQIDGTISANGSANGSGGAGSGGGIFLWSQGSFAGGSAAVIRANGGNASHGGGGGGRVAVWIGVADGDYQRIRDGTDMQGVILGTHYQPYRGLVSVPAGSGNSNGIPGTAFYLTTNLLLTITGAPANYGNPSPDGYGTTPQYGYNSSVTNTVFSPADQTNGGRHVCLGWSLKNPQGGDEGSGVTTQAVFSMTTNLTLTWSWTNEYLLTVTNGGSPNGSVNAGVVNAWYTNAVSVTGITATANGGYVFYTWIGDVPTGHETDNPLTVTMDQARTLQAQFISSGSATKTWSGTGAWESGTNWSPVGMPGPNDDAILASGSVLLGQSRQARSVIVSNAATLVFTNWSTCLTAETVTVRSGGTLTLAPAFTNNLMSNRLHIVCTDFILETGASINADGKGHGARTGSEEIGFGYGPGAGEYVAGGGYGGEGGDWTTRQGGSPYGTTNMPSEPGSGAGGGPGWTGTAGGGLIWVRARGAMWIDGTVSANGLANGSGGAGSGGGIFLWSQGTFVGGSNAVIRADGGNASHGGGGGGRVAVWHKVRESERDRILAGDLCRVTLTNSPAGSPFLGTVSATNGTGNAGGTPGTIVFVKGAVPPSTILTIW